MEQEASCSAGGIIAPRGAGLRGGMRSIRTKQRITFLGYVLLSFTGWGSVTAAAADAVITVKSGMQFQGRFHKIVSLVENPLAPQSTAAGKPIVIIDDDLRYTFVGNHYVAAIAESPPGTPERIKIDQRVAETGRPVASVGFPLQITPFDEFGRARTRCWVSGHG